MSIVAYTGLPGHGKSYGVVEHVILPALRACRVVVTNIPLNVGALAAEIPGCSLLPFDIASFEREPSLITGTVPAGAVVVIDEAWRLWPQGMQGNKVPEPFRAFLAEHRHMVDAAGNSQQIVLVTQDLQQLASFARGLVEETFRVRKLTAVGLGKRFVVDVYRGPVTGQSPPERLRVRQIPGKYRAEVWRFYQSHTKREGEGSGANEATMDRRGVLWRSPLFWLGGPALLVVLIIGIWKVWGFLHRGAAKAKPAAVAVSRPGDIARAVASAPVVGAEWRIVGYIAEWDKIFLSDGFRYVTLSIARYCDFDAADFYVCRWDGKVISSQVRYLQSQQGPSRSLDVLGSTVVTAH